MYCRICSQCGAYLDPCENCTCAQKLAEAECFTQDKYYIMEKLPFPPRQNKIGAFCKAPAS